MQKASALVPALQSNWLMMHVSLMMLSYAILLLGSLFSIIFLIIFLPLPTESSSLSMTEEKISSSLISKKQRTQSEITFEIEQIFENYLNYTSSIQYFPPYFYGGGSLDYVRSRFLIALDNWSYRAISLGFPLLTIGIIAGAVWANEAWGSYWSWDPKETWALITWLVFAAYLHVRLIVGWSGKGPAILASLGFFVVWICYLGVNFLGQGLHSYGWLS